MASNYKSLLAFKGLCPLESPIETAPPDLTHSPESGTCVFLSTGSMNHTPDMATTLRVYSGKVVIWIHDHDKYSMYPCMKTLEIPTQRVWYNCVPRRPMSIADRYEEEPKQLVTTRYKKRFFLGKWKREERWDDAPAQWKLTLWSDADRRSPISAADTTE